MTKKVHKGRVSGTKNKTFNVPVLSSLTNDDKKPIIARDSPIPLETMIRKVETGTYDVNPPYQRGSIWSNNYKAKLIASILKGIRINTIHIALNPTDKTSYYVIDGKQRLEAIQSYKNGEIWVAIEKKDLTMLKLDFQTLMRSDDIDAVLYRNKWVDSSLMVTEHIIEDRDVTETIKEHIRIFRNVNCSKELSAEEKMLCPAFMTRKFLQYLHDNGFGKVCEHSSTNIKSNDRLEALGSLLTICYTSFGSNLNDIDGFAFRNIKSADVTPSAEGLHEFLWINNLDANTQFDLELLKKMGLDIIASRVKKASKWLYSILSFKNDIPKEILKGQLFDFMIFLLKKIEQNILTDNFVYAKGNLEKMYQWFIEFLDLRFDYLKDVGSNDSAGRKDAIERRHNLAEQVWSKYFKDEIKNKSVSAHKKRKALAKSQDRCPYSGERLRKDNSAIDHISPKSYTEDTEFMVISETSNIIKGGVHPSFAETYIKIATKEEYDKLQKDEKELAKLGKESKDIFKD